MNNLSNSELAADLYEHKNRQSVKDWNELAPIIMKELGAVKCESPDYHLTEEDINADRNQGKDKIFTLANGKVLTSALRIQRDKHWATFSMRLTTLTNQCTEYSKRLSAVKEGRTDDYPHLSIQGYIVDGKISYAIVRTKDLFETIIAHTNIMRVLRNKDEGNQFVVVSWDDLEKLGVKIKRCDV